MPENSYFFDCKVITWQLIIRSSVPGSRSLRSESRSNQHPISCYPREPPRPLSRGGDSPLPASFWPGPVSKPFAAARIAAAGSRREGRIAAAQKEARLLPGVRNPEKEVRICMAVRGHHCRALRSAAVTGGSGASFGGSLRTSGCPNVNYSLRLPGSYIPKRASGPGPISAGGPGPPTVPQRLLCPAIGVPGTPHQSGPGPP